MKRLVLSAVLLAAAMLGFAQAPFTIVRPADGSKVRETVKVLLPKHSIPPGGYVGVYLNGEFVEAVVPSVQGDYHVYMLDTKARGIQDGVHNLEFVLYVDYNGRPEVTERSSVEITVANQASIPIPADGFLLRYRFQPGQQYIYNLKQQVSQASISDDQNRLGGRGVEQGSLTENIRLQYVVANRYGDGDALLRVLALPEKGKNFLLFTQPGTQQASTFRKQDMNPIFMRLTNTGMEEFSSIPVYFGLFGNSGKSATPVQMFAIYPLPTLPNKRVKPGDIWQSRFQLPIPELAALGNSDSLVFSVPARAEFVGVEWQSGHPCAKIKHTFAMGGAPGMTANFSENLVALEETVWFALDKGTVVRVVRSETIETREVVRAPQPGTRGTGFPPGFEGQEFDPEYFNSLPPEQQQMLIEQGRMGGMPPGGVGRPTQQQPPQLQRIRIQQVFSLE